MFEVNLIILIPKNINLNFNLLNDCFYINSNVIWELFNFLFRL